jgi:ABC-type Mn2+/Zn2+ transport system permease subunit
MAAVPSILTALSLAIACATLSVFVVCRRWAFIGEGISHSGFGGAGTVWLLMLAFPTFAAANWAPYVGVVVFCVLTALLIGYFTRTEKVNSDAVIGIFLVASLAWGFLAQQIFRHLRQTDPAGFQMLLFGQMDVTPQSACISATICAAIVVTVVFLGKEIVAYCFDPATAEAAGVRVAFIHYLLMVLVSLTIVVGVRLAGSVLVPALLVLPGASALLLSKQLRNSVIISLAIALVGALGGVAIHSIVPFMPPGPPIVLLLFAQFVIAFVWAKLVSERS